MRNWCQAGFYFILGKLPLPSALKAQNCTVYVASQGTVIQSTVRLNVAQPHASSQAVTPKSTGVLFNVAIGDNVYSQHHSILT